MKAIYTLLILLIPFVGFGQDFLKIIGDSLTQFGNDIIKTNDGNILIAGYNGDNDERDGLLVKLNYQGEVIWQKNIGGYNLDQFHSVIDDNGFYYICGKSSSYSTDTVSDILIVKTDYQGNIVWSKVYGGNGCAGPYCGENGVKIIKEFENQFIVLGNAASVGNGLIDAYIIKIDNDGNLVYNSIIDSGNGSQLFKSGTVNSSGNLLISGQNKVGTWEPWLRKVDSNGDMIFSKCYGDASTIGNTSSGIIEKNDTTFFLITNADGTDGLIKIDAIGDTMFCKEFTGTGSKDIIFSNDSNSIFILGNYNSNTNYLLNIDLNGNLIENHFVQNLNLNKVIEIDNDLFILSNPSQNTNGMSDIALMNFNPNNNCSIVNIDDFSYSNYSIQITPANEYYSNISQNSSEILYSEILELNKCIGCIQTNFSYDINNLLVDFTNLSTTEVFYKWEIDNQLILNDYNINYEFNGIGVYEVCLTSFDSCSSVQLCQDIEIFECQTANSIISKNSCSSYEWNGMIYENSGTYEFDTVASNGCDSTAVLELEICYLDQLEINGPTAAVTSTTSSFSVQDNTGSAFIWSIEGLGTINSGQYTNEIFIDWSEIEGITSVCVYEKYDCSGLECLGDTVCLEVELKRPAGVVENNLEVNIYPNPSSNIFNLEFNSDSETEILVTNVLGEQVYFESIQSIGEYNTKIDLSNYSEGIYNLTIKTSDGISNHKLILQ